MNDRLFGLDTSNLNITAPKPADLEAEMERTFGAFGFHSSLDFSLTQDA